jgi:DNA-binding CsgD family transcriptional regulator
VGEALAALPGADPDGVAYHFQQAGDPRAAEWLIRAGERATQSYAWLSAAARFEAALAPMQQAGAAPRERAVLLVRLAMLHRYTAQERGLAWLDEAAPLAQAAGDRALSALILFEQGHFRGYLGDLRGGLAGMATGVAALDALGPADRARLHEIHATLYGEDSSGTGDGYRGTFVDWLVNVGRYGEVRAIGEPLVARALDPTGSGGWRGAGYGDACSALAEARVMFGRPDDARRAFAQARAIYRAAAHHYQAARVTLYELALAVLPYHTDQLAERERLAAEGEEAWRQASGALSGVAPRTARLPLLCLEGHWAEARALAQAARAARASASLTALATELLGPLAREQGDAPLAWALVRELVPAGPIGEPGDTDFRPALALQRVATALALDAGDLPAARAWLEAHDRWLAWNGAVLGRAEGHLLWAAYHRAAGEYTLASRHAEEGLAHAATPRQPLTLLAAHRTLGELETVAGRHAKAQAHFDEALALAEACAAPYERAQTLLALAELRAATGERDAALALLDEARAICAPLEARPALARADALAARLTAAPPPVAPALGYPAGLTPREVEVLRLVAAGLTDAQVAERLSLSPRTVTTHLTSIYNKLSVSSRLAAARFALDHRLA